MEAPSANLEDSTTTGASCVVPHGDIVSHHLRTSGNVDSAAILGGIAQHLGVREGQLGDIVGGHTASLCPLVHAATGVVHVQGGSVCIPKTQLQLRVGYFGSRHSGLRHLHSGA